MWKCRLNFALQFIFIFIMSSVISQSTPPIVTTTGPPTPFLSTTAEPPEVTTPKEFNNCEGVNLGKRFLVKLFLFY